MGIATSYGVEKFIEGKVMSLQIYVRHWGWHLTSSKCWASALFSLVPFPVRTDQLPLGVNINSKMSYGINWGDIYTQAILTFHPQIVFPPESLNCVTLLKNCLSPQPFQPLSHVPLVLPAVFSHFLFGVHGLHWTWRSLQFTGHSISQVITPSLWRVSHLIWFFENPLLTLPGMSPSSSH